MLLTVFFKSRSGVSNKEKSAGLADFFPCMWSRLASSHHGHFDSAAFLQKNAFKAVSSLHIREALEKVLKYITMAKILYWKT